MNITYIKMYNNGTAPKNMAHSSLSIVMKKNIIIKKIITKCHSFIALYNAHPIGGNTHPRKTITSSRVKQPAASLHLIFFLLDSSVLFILNSPSILIISLKSRYVNIYL